MPKPITSQNSRFLPTTCNAVTARPPARSTKAYFYLMARGIPAKEAEALLIQAFVGEIIETIAHDGLREALLERGGRMAEGAENEAHDTPRSENGRLRCRARSARIFRRWRMQIYGKPLVYLDNAASAQKPKAVLDRLREPTRAEYANVHRGLHYLANAATEAYEGARENVRGFLNAERAEEIVFTRNATEAINLVAYTFGRERIKPGDEIVLSIMEHHSNIVPWHFLRERQGAVIKWAPVDDEGNFLLDEFEKLLTPRTKMVADHADVERARHGGAGQGSRQARACARHSGAGRWRAGRGASRRRRARSRLRFLCFHRPQALWPDRHRRALRQARSIWRRCRRSTAAAR